MQRSAAVGAEVTVWGQAQATKNLRHEWETLLVPNTLEVSETDRPLGDFQSAIDIDDAAAVDALAESVSSRLESERAQDEQRRRVAKAEQERKDKAAERARAKEREDEERRKRAQLAKQAKMTEASQFLRGKVANGFRVLVGGQDNATVVTITMKDEQFVIASIDVGRVTDSLHRVTQEACSLTWGNKSFERSAADCVQLSTRRGHWQVQIVSTGDSHELWLFRQFHRESYVPLPSAEKLFAQLGKRLLIDGSRATAEDGSPYPFEVTILTDERGPRFSWRSGEIPRGHWKQLPDADQFYPVSVVDELFPTLVCQRANAALKIRLYPQTNVDEHATVALLQHRDVRDGVTWEGHAVDVTVRRR